MAPNVTPPLPGTGLTAPKRGVRDIPRPVPLGGTTTAPQLMQSLDGIVSSVQAREQAAQDVAQDVLVSAERTAALMGSIMDRAQTMMGMGVGSGITGSMALGGGMPAWAAYAQSGLIGLPGVNLPMVQAGTGGSAVFQPGALPGTATQIHGIGAPPPNSGVPPVATTGAADGGPPPSQPPTRLPGRGSGNVEGGVPRTAVPAAEPAGPGAVWPQSFEEGQQFVTGPGGGFTLGGIRQNAARGINRRVSEWATSSQQTLVDDLGNPIKIDGKVQTRAVPRGTPTTAQGVVNLTEDGMVADLAEGYQPTWREGLAANAKNIAGNMAGGAGLGESITSAVPAIGKAAGVVGAVYTGVNMGLNFAEGQRSKNQEFQSMLGGANSEGFGERWRQNMFRLSLRGTMSGADAEAIYKGGVANYGNQSESRRTYESAAVDLYRNVGVSGDEAVSLLDQAAKRGNDNLYQYADAIREVSRAAKEAGEDARDSRKAFEESFARTSTFSTGSAAIQSALTSAKVTTSLGDQFADADFSNMESPINRRRMADLLNMDFTDFSAEMIRGGRGASMLLARGKDALVASTIQEIDPRGAIQADAMAMVQRVASANGGKMPSGEAFNPIVADLMEKYGDSLDPTRIQAIANAVSGQDLDENEAMAYFVQYLARPDLKFTKVEEENQRDIDKMLAPMDTRQLGSDSAASLANGVLTKAKTPAEKKVVEKYLARIEELKGKGYTPDQARIKADREDAALRKKNREVLDKRISKDFGDAVDVNSDWYKDRMSGRDSFDFTGNKRDALKKAILMEGSQGNYSGVGAAIWKNYDEFGDKARFEVQTADGKRAVTAMDLVTKYADQLQDNPEAIKVIGAKKGGATVGDILGIDDTGKKPSKTGSAGEAAGYGSETPKEARNKAGKADGRVVIEAGPVLRDLLDIRADGIAKYYADRGQTPPSSTELTPGDRTGVGN